MELNATRFPFPLPPRTIGEQKAKVKAFFFVAQALLPVLFLCIHTFGMNQTSTKPHRQECLCYRCALDHGQSSGFAARPAFTGLISIYLRIRSSSAESLAQ
jgi:hypothetical protein